MASCTKLPMLMRFTPNSSNTLKSGRSGTHITLTGNLVLSTMALISCSALRQGKNTGRAHECSIIDLNNKSTLNWTH
jgi:hypothetical protein